MYKKFRDIPQFPSINYSVTISWKFLEEHLKTETEITREGISTLQLEPNFQRGHVWTLEQKISYLEYQLSGGTSGREIYLNHPGWMSTWKGDYVLVDGLQRITAVREFLNNKIAVFGSFINDFEDRMPFDLKFIFNVCSLKTRKEVLNWYLLMNSGGTPHSQNELERVRKLLEKEV